MYVYPVTALEQVNLSKRRIVQTAKGKQNSPNISFIRAVFYVITDGFEHPRRCRDLSAVKNLKTKNITVSRTVRRLVLLLN